MGVRDWGTDYGTSNAIYVTEKWCRHFIRINSNGDLGLGTREPQYKFHVKENDLFSPTNVEANIESQVQNYLLFHQ